MKKLLLMGVMLSWGGAAAAQNSDQCTSATAPVIERTDVATLERTGDNEAVIQIDVVASLPDGRALTYVFAAPSGTITNDGSRATWSVQGEGPFEASVEVSAADYHCVRHAYFTYHMERPASD